jgi:hypothetical protein
MEENQENNQAATANPETSNGDDNTDNAKVERWKQQLRGREKEVKEVRTEAERYKGEASAAQQRADRLKQHLAATVYVDGEINKRALEKIAEEDPETADEIARGFQIGNRAAESAQDLLNSLPSGNTPKNKAPAVSQEELVEKIARKLKSELQYDRALDEVEKVFSQLPTKSQDNAVALFKEITEGKKNLTPDQAKRYANMVMLDLGVKAEKSPTRKISSLASVGLGNANYSAPAVNDDEIDELLKNMIQGAGHHGSEMKQLLKLK